MTTQRSSSAAEALSLAPFRGVRYAPQRVSSLAAVTSPPYDVVVHPDGLRHLETADPHNVVRLILPHCADPAGRHELAARTMRQWQHEGILATDPQAALYVYEQRDGGLVQRGLIGTLALDGPVLPHEDVMATTVADRAELMRATSANLEPLLLTYRGGGTSDDVAGGTAARAVETAAALPPLLVTTTEDGVRHSLWAITDPAEIRAVSEDLAGFQALIADGHHRWATYRLLSRERGGTPPWDRGLVLLVDSGRYPLRVRAIHRVLRRLPVSKALGMLGGAFRVRHLDGPLAHAMTELADAAAAGNAFLLAGEDDPGYHLLTDPDQALLDSTVPTDRPDAWRRLDATVLHHCLLNRVWAIPDNSEEIGYLHDTAAAERKARSGGGTAVLMHPVEESVVRELAQQGVMMPRKSTSFGPKPATGLVLRDLTME